jgi:dethiobiotin synthase
VIKGLFVTGTDTGVGKTVTAAALLHRLRRHSRVRYWKPIQTGIEQDDDTAEAARLGACAAGEVFDAGIRLERPLSPHLSAKLAGRTIDVEATVALAEAEPAGATWIVEGAGGALVPITDTVLMVDLMARLGLSAVVVARTALGTINHTLLTLDALRRRSIRPAGVIMVGVPNRDNREAIERYGGIEVLGELPHLAPLTAESLGSWASDHLDPRGRLVALLS